MDSLSKADVLAHTENNSFAIVEIDKALNISIDGFHNCEDKYMKQALQSN